MRGPDSAQLGPFRGPEPLLAFASGIELSGEAGDRWRSAVPVPGEERISRAARDFG
jgi:hypothetical protein